MIQINEQVPLKDILPFVKNWMKLLAEGNLATACSHLDRPNCYGISWTPELIEQTVASIFPPKSSFFELHHGELSFTNPYLLEEQKDLEVLSTEQNKDFLFDYAVPINGQWSDITAQFEFIRSDGGFAVILHDLHVL